MIRIYIIIFLFLNFATIGWNQPENKIGLNILTFNILHGATIKGDFDLDLIAGIIKNTDPDFVALQEVDLKTNRSRQYDIGTELGIRTGLISFFGMAMPYD
jgi:endonuclease/exonuclease/phosphatase family metal-dependent hydrolase